MKLRLQFNSIRRLKRSEVEQFAREKDLACLDGTEEENFDTFPHILAGTKH